MVNLHSIYADAGRLTEAAAVALESVGVVERLGLQRRKGVWCRCDAAVVLTQLGRHDEALALLDQAQDLAPQGIDQLRTDLTRGLLMVRLGRFDEARTALERARRAGDGCSTGS